jgi:hypothetical protein
MRHSRGRLSDGCSSLFGETKAIITRAQKCWVILSRMMICQQAMVSRCLGQSFLEPHLVRRRKIPVTRHGCRLIIEGHLCLPSGASSYRIKQAHHVRIGASDNL